MMTMTGERWLPVPGYEGRYEVSDLGRVRSLTRRGRNNRTYGGRVLSPAPYGDYLAVSLGRRPTAHVHQLVAAAFLGERPAGHYIRHLDGNCLNNALANLAYGTPSDNVRDSVRHGTHAHAAQTHCVRGHPFDEANTSVRPGSTGRACRACKREWQRKWRARQRAEVAA